MKTLLKLTTQRSVYPICNTVKIEKNKAFGWDGSIAIITPCDTPDGLYDAHYLKAGAVELSQEDGADYKAADSADLVADMVLNVADLEWVSSAMCKDETRYYLCGIFIRNGGMFSTNGNIAKFQKADIKIEEGFIMSDDMVKYILLLAGEEKVKEIRVTIDTNKQIRAYVGQSEVIAQAIDGTYPTIDRVVPEDDKEANFDYAAFKAWFKVNKQILAIKDKTYMRVSAALFCDGLDFDIFFNAKLLDITELSGKFGYSEALSAVKIVNGPRMAVLMPMRA